MKKAIITTQLAVALLVAPAFAANDKSYTYLALGDSVAFGLDPLLLRPYSTQSPIPEEFIGFPEIVAAAEHLLQSNQEVNASCPGETSGSFLDTVALDYGCNSPHYLPPPFEPLQPFKTSIGLHTNYTGAQIDFAVSQLRSNKHISLVTLVIGANDVALVSPQLEQCGSNSPCAQAVLGPVLQVYAENLAQILTRIRAEYQGRLVLIKYYSPTPALVPVTLAVNNVMTQVVAQLGTQRNFTGITFADGFTAFQLASALFNHDACQAGLLVRLPASASTPPCDIHPSRLGQELLAATVESAISAKH